MNQAETGFHAARMLATMGMALMPSAGELR
jgi:hypothetical protein